MGKDLISELSKLKMAEATIKRALDTSFSRVEKKKIFIELQKIQKEIELVKFKIQLEKEINKWKYVI